MQARPSVLAACLLTGAAEGGEHGVFVHWWMIAGLLARVKPNKGVDLFRVARYKGCTETESEMTYLVQAATEWGIEQGVKSETVVGSQAPVLRQWICDYAYFDGWDRSVIKTSAGDILPLTPVKWDDIFPLWKEKGSFEFAAIPTFICKSPGGRGVRVYPPPCEDFVLEVKADLTGTRIQKETEFLPILKTAPSQASARGRPPKGPRAMTAAERSAAQRKRAKDRMLLWADEVERLAALPAPRREKLASDLAAEMRAAGCSGK